MKKITRLLGLTLIAALVLGGCGQSSNNTTSTEQSEKETETENAIDFTGDGYDSSVDYSALAGTTIKIAASPVPHKEILEVAKEILAQADITLDIIEYDDYVQPNMVVDSGEVDANFFQHQPYLTDFNAENGTDLVSAAGVHVEPMGIYAGKSASLDDIKDGAQIAVPNDNTNEARSLLLLEKQGLFTLDPDAGIAATAKDIVENPHNIEIVEVEAAQLPRVLRDVDYAVINSNYAIEADLNPVEDALAIEDSTSDYVNIIAVKSGNENTDAIKALVAAVTSQKVYDFIQDNYEGSVVPTFK